ncbi:hypothetical protein TNCV_1699681 [Trichonephila clavipes]|nr:hypothetical protein TNCV_1699681 [Trichonephila clavipes]
MAHTPLYMSSLTYGEQVARLETDHVALGSLPIVWLLDCQRWRLVPWSMAAGHFKEEKVKRWIEDQMFGQAFCCGRFREGPELLFGPHLWGSNETEVNKPILQPIAMINLHSRNQLPIDSCLNEATPPPTSQANNTSNIVVSRQGVEDRVIDPVSCAV